MQQLRLYPNTDRNQAEGMFIDLYEQEPIKLTLSVEDLTNTEANSAFSKTFRVPGTGNNNKFFQHAFLIDGVDYDVTVKKPADIIIDGLEFKLGHVRLQKVYINKQGDTIEYELLFLGETRDLSSKIGDVGLCQLDIPELVHVLNYNNVTTSWQAFPEGDLNDGLKNGDIIYPLIDHGNTYAEISGVEQPRISDEGPNKFTDSNNGITVERFKPMIRAKRLLDQIFEDAGFTFTSNFLNSELFKKIYISAFGNEASVSLNVNANSVNNFNVSSDTTVTNVNLIPFDIEISDPGDNFDIIGEEYTAPATGSYTFNGSVFSEAFNEFGSLNCTIEIRVNNVAAYTTPEQPTPSTIVFNQDLNLNAGDKVKLFLVPTSTADVTRVRERFWESTSSAGLFNPTNALDCEYKQIEFLRDILKLFRLVISPDPVNPTNFIIEPWQDYVFSTKTRDWSSKLVNDKDFQIEPLFDTQSDRIEFRFEEDGDYLNNYQLDAYQEPYGYLGFDSGNDLLKGTREIDVKFAPTPISQIEGAIGTWIIPLLHTHDAGETGVEHLPIAPQTRILFYNGLKSTGKTWYIEDPGEGTVGFDNYPLVSPYESFPQTADGLNLNWSNDIQYWGTSIAGYNQQGQTLFSKYWSNYIANLYNKFARRVTAYFILNSVDLQTFQFSDVIFVDGVYYRAEKIENAPIGEKTAVKVQLLKSPPDYRPDEFLDRIAYDLLVTDVLCNGDNSGQVEVTVTAGAPPYNYILQPTGDTGFSNDDTFTISNLGANNYDITITDAIGVSETQTFTITQPPQLDYNSSEVLESPCGEGNGEITITPIGGTPDYTIAWNDGPTTFTRTGLSAGLYTFTITDANGCRLTDEYELDCIDEPLQAIVVDETDPTNCDTTDGSILFEISGGTTPYTLTIDGNTYTSNNDPANINVPDLGAGTYNWNVTDADGTQVDGTVKLSCGITEFTFAEGANALDACDNFDSGTSITTVYTRETPIDIGTFFFETEQGAQDNDPADYVNDGWYSDGVDAYNVENGQVIAIESCDQTPDTFAYKVTEAQSGADGACTLADSNQFTKTVFSTCSSIAIGCFLSNSQSGAINETDPVINGFYGALVNGSTASVQVTDGFIVDIQFC